MRNKNTVLIVKLWELSTRTNDRNGKEELFSKRIGVYFVWDSAERHL